MMVGAMGATILREQVASYEDAYDELKTDHDELYKHYDNLSVELKDAKADRDKVLSELKESDGQLVEKVGALSQAEEEVKKLKEQEETNAAKLKSSEGAIAKGA